MDTGTSYEKISFIEKCFYISTMVLFLTSIISYSNNYTDYVSNKYNDNDNKNKVNIYLFFKALLSLLLLISFIFIDKKDFNYKNFLYLLIYLILLCIIIFSSILLFDDKLIFDNIDKDTLIILFVHIYRILLIVIPLIALYLKK